MQLFFFFNDTATTEIYTLSLHDALPILRGRRYGDRDAARGDGAREGTALILQRVRVQPTGARWPTFQASHSVTSWARSRTGRSEEHTSELQSPCNLVCRLLLEKKNKKKQ